MHSNIMEHFGCLYWDLAIKLFLCVETHVPLFQIQNICVQVKKARALLTFCVFVCVWRNLLFDRWASSSIKYLMITVQRPMNDCYTHMMMMMTSVRP